MRELYERNAQELSKLKNSLTEMQVKQAELEQVMNGKSEEVVSNSFLQRNLLFFIIFPIYVQSVVTCKFFAYYLN